MILPIYRRMQDENRELRRALAIMWHAWHTDNRPPVDVLILAERCYVEGRRVAKEPEC